MHFMLPCLLTVYVGIILQGYSVKEFNGLVTNRYFLLGACVRVEGGRVGSAPASLTLKKPFPPTNDPIPPHRTASPPPINNNQKQGSRTWRR